MLVMRSYHNLHPLLQVKSSYVDYIDQDNSFDIFDMVTNIDELAKELVNWESLIFHNYQDDAKYIKCLLEWERKHESMFSIIDF